VAPVPRKASQTAHHMALQSLQKLHISLCSIITASVRSLAVRVISENDTTAHGLCAHYANSSPSLRIWRTSTLRCGACTSHYGYCLTTCITGHLKISGTAQMMLEPVPTPYDTVSNMLRDRVRCRSETYWDKGNVSAGCSRPGKAVSTAACTV
jgi:hypothetical protein